MEELNLGYAEKNIGLHSKDLIKTTLVSRTEDVISRMRWKLFHIRFPTDRERKETFGFRTPESAPIMDELVPFEKDLIKLIKNVKFKPAGNTLTNKIRSDLNDVKGCQDILVKGDKSRRIYKVPKQTYEKEMTDKISSNYRKADRDLVNDVNKEAAAIANKLGDLDERIDAMPESESFITYKDHKINFPARKEVRLLNPSKSNIGKISKKILDAINSTLRQKTSFNQWKSTNECIQWFSNLPEKQSLKFIKLDIQNFYPEIGLKLLQDSIDWAKNYVTISREDVEIIMHCRKSFLFFKGEVFAKSENRDFSVEQGSLDSAEISELVGLFILSKLTEIIPKEQNGLYRDDMIIAVKTTGRGSELLGQQLSKLFKDNFNLKITFEANLRIVNFLDVTLSLDDGSYRPYRKDDTVPLYIHKDSNHPPHIKKEMVNMVGRRISDLSSSEEIFKQAAPIYNQALRNSGFNEEIKFSKRTRENKRATRSRRIIFFHPPWSDQIHTRIGKSFLQLLDKHFPRGSELFHYFSRQKVKVSYSILPNVSRILKSHNRQILHPEQKLQLKGCDCEEGRNGRECIEENSHCLTENVCYLGKLDYEITHPVTRTQVKIKKKYFGLTQNSFKSRHSGHKTSFKHPKYKTQTRLSRAIWRLKESNPPIPFKLKFSILKLARAYTRESRNCHLCAVEKTFIAFSDPSSMLNLRSELLNKCRHRRKHLLFNWK